MASTRAASRSQGPGAVAVMVPAAAALVLAACAGSPTSSTSSGYACGTAGAAPTGSVWAFDFGEVARSPTMTLPKDTATGSRAIWDEDPDGWIALGPEVTGEPVVQFAMTINPPVINGQGYCYASVTWAVMSTTDVRVGTADKFNARYYEFMPVAPVGRVLVDYISPTVIAGEFSLPMVRVIPHPAMPPVYAETIEVHGAFVARKPGR